MIYNSSKVFVLNFVIELSLIINNLFLRDPIGNKPQGFYGLSRLTMSYLFDNKFLFSYLAKN